MKFFKYFPKTGRAFLCIFSQFSLRAFQVSAFALGFTLMTMSVWAAPGALLPPGYLTTAGNQITDLSGHKVRLACVGYQPSASDDIASDVRAIVGAGFNCVRYPWYDANLASHLVIADRIVRAAGAVGLKVILDHHGNETPGPSNNWLPFPCNGLPFDTGPGTDGTDGCGDRGTVSRAQFVQNWVTIARRYAGNPTVIGFDLTNEPHLSPDWYADNPGGATWNDGAATDLRAIYAEVGNAIQAVNPDVLIIAEGIINFTDRSLSGSPNPIVGYPDLSAAANAPVTLSRPSQLIYSIHDYPAAIAGTALDSGVAKVKAMNVLWGYLVTARIAPVWVGEMGASLDGLGPDSIGSANGAGSRLLAEQDWASTLVAYLNGGDGALGGPTLRKCDAGVSTNWWAWGNMSGSAPDGALGNNAKVRTQQQKIYAQLRYVPQRGC